MTATKSLTEILRAFAEECLESVPRLSSALSDAAEQLEVSACGMLCPFCDGTGCSGTGHDGEAIDCHYCDNGVIRPEDVKRQRDTLDERVGDCMAFDVEREEFAKRIAELELRIAHGPRREGNIEMQAAAWAEVYRTCVECGLLSFDPLETGRARVVGFIRHLAGKIEV